MCRLVRGAMCLLVLVACGETGVAAEREGVATPLPYLRQYQYIPVGSSSSADFPDATSARPLLAPSELIMTVMRTALDVVRGINSRRANSMRVQPAARAPPGLGAGARRNHTRRNHARPQERLGSARGYGEDYYDEPPTTTTAKPAKPRYTDPWAGYYDFLINEGSFKFWSIFQLFTAGLLLYACLSAIYYAKFNPIIPDYDREYDDYFLERRVGRQARSLDPSALPSGLSWIGPQTFQFIMDAIAKNYEK